jgi:hypothetical protein
MSASGSQDPGCVSGRDRSDRRRRLNPSLLLREHLFELWASPYFSGVLSRSLGDRLSSHGGLDQFTIGLLDHLLKF